MIYIQCGERTKKCKPFLRKCSKKGKSGDCRPELAIINHKFFCHPWVFSGRHWKGEKMVSGTCSWTSEATLSLIKSLSTGILADCSCQEFLPFSPPHWYVGFLTFACGPPCYSLCSTYEWNHTIMVCLCLTYSLITIPSSPNSSLKSMLYFYHCVNLVF